VVPLGLDLTGHGLLAREPSETFRIGYLARICPEKGLHILAEAFKLLSDGHGKEKVSLHIAGWLGKRDEAYFEGVRDQLDSWGLGDRVTYLHDFERDEKIAFLSRVDILSVPTPYREPKGLFALEAMANGIPIVQPNHGCFPEYIERTGGGLLVEEPTPGDIAEGIQKLMDDPELRLELSARGVAGVKDYYTDDRMAEDTFRVYQRHLDAA